MRTGKLENHVQDAAKKLSESLGQTGEVISAQTVSG
tara:strand:+ start:68 stop:175 length:108 start_codon:yes stop_codon:yes gene_type:complete